MHTDHEQSLDCFLRPGNAM